MATRNLPDPETEGKRYRKAAGIWAIRMDNAFIVETMGGEMMGKAGDWLAKNSKGELQVIDAESFEKAYVADPS